MYSRPATRHATKKPKQTKVKSQHNLKDGSCQRIKEFLNELLAFTKFHQSISEQIVSVSLISLMSLTRYFFAESSVPADMVAQVSARQVVHHEVEVLSVLKRVIHVNNEEILELCENLAFVDHGLDAALRDDPGLWHLFHSVVLLRLLPLNPPHLAEASLSNAEMVDEVSLGHSCTKWEDSD